MNAKRGDPTLSPVNLESSRKPFEFKMADVGVLRKEQNCLFILHNAAVKKVKQKRGIAKLIPIQMPFFSVFSKHRLTTLLFFIFQEFT